MTYLPRLGRRLAAALAALQLLLAASGNAYADPATQYIYISKQAPQRLYVIDGGRILFESPVNTGVRAAPTPDGRFRIFASLRRRTMKGTDPRTGRRYNDKDVPYVMYFDGGKAIHGFYRRGYGYPQSLGCIELPVYKAKELYQLLDGGIGTEVVVAQGRPQISYAERSYAERKKRARPAYPDYATDQYFQEAMQE
jgi:lipoprotein-anchoring transpeptidase ErfK/SrfK